MNELMHVARNLFGSPVASHEPKKGRCERVLEVLFYQCDAVFWMHEAPKYIGGNDPANAAPKNYDGSCSHISFCFLGIRTSPQSRVVFFS
jgi:hypothetical protein